MSESTEATIEQRTILIADDDRLQRVMYETFMNGRPYTLYMVEDGSKVIPTLNRINADLLILDLSMPEMDGLEVLELLRRDPFHHRLPVLIVSATEHEDVVAKGLALGADDYIVKPLRQGELVAKINMVFRRRQLAELTRGGFVRGTLFAGRYEVGRKIGAGGFSTIYKATDMQADPPLQVALKVFSFSSAQRNDERYMSYFLREGFEHSRLSHPNIVKMHDFGQADALFYIAMEYLDGLTAYDIEKRTGPFSEETALILGCQVTRALQYLSHSQLMHRDVKPQNIMVTPSGIAKLLDFGLARRVTEETLSGGDDFRGSPHFVSPEHIRADPALDIRTDIYSLGVTLYYLLSGVHPFESESPTQIMHHHLETEPLHIAAHCPTLSPAFSYMIMRMLVKDPQVRVGIDELMEWFDARINNLDL